MHISTDVDLPGMYEHAFEWLEDYLIASGGAAKVVDIRRDAFASHITIPAVLDSASKRNHVTVRNHSGSTWWSLPDNPQKKHKNGR